MNGRPNTSKPPTSPMPNTPVEDIKLAKGSYFSNSGTKKKNSGVQEPVNTLAPTRGQGFTCNCGKIYLSKATLARHEKECGKRDTSKCKYCDRTFPTFSGVRQHERKGHPDLYLRDMEALLPAPDSELMEKIADIEASSSKGVFYTEMMASTGLTRQQVRSRREKPEYIRYLERARAKLAASIAQQKASSPSALVAGPSTSKGPQIPLSQPMRITRSRSQSIAAATVQVVPPLPPSGVRKVSSSQPGPNIRPVSRTRLISSGARRGTVATNAPVVLSPIRAENGSSRTEAPHNGEIEPTLITPTPPINTPGLCLNNICPRVTRTTNRRRSRSLCSPKMTQNGTPADDNDLLAGNNGELVNLLTNELPNVNKPHTRDLILAALYEPANDVVVKNIDAWLTTSFGHKKTSVKRPNKKRSAPKNYGQLNTGNNSRSQLYKKAQDLYRKNRKGLATAIITGSTIGDKQVWPTIQSVEDLYGAILESPADRDQEPFVPKDREPNVLQSITEDEIQRAKLGWQSSAPGLDGVEVAAVKTMSDKELCILFNVILFRNVQPTSWRTLRTTLVPKEGDLTNPSNWRPITIGSTVERLLHRVLVHRLKKMTDLSAHQRGFIEVDGTLGNALILDTYIQHRTSLGKPYHVVSLDVKKAFDSVSQESIKRALERFRVPCVLAEYIMSTFNTSTTIKVGQESTRPIRICRGVRQGDPLSPLLFNLVVDELLENLNARYRGGSLPGGTYCAAMAFADDLIIMSDHNIDMPLLLDETQEFLQRRGMLLNPAKCKSLVAGASRGISVPRTRISYKINNEPIPNVMAMDAFKYLGHQFGHSGVEKPGIYNLTTWLQKLSTSPLKPDQKLNILKQYVIPRLLYGLQNPKITGKVLRAADRLIRKHVRATLHLNAHTPDALLHASVRDGGLGIMELKSSIPRIFLGRLVRLLEGPEDGSLSSVLQSTPIRDLMGRLQKMAGDVPGAAFWRDKISSQILSKGLEQASEDPSSRSWVDKKPFGWSGRDYVRAVQLRTANLPTKAIPSVPRDQRRCRGNCAVDENLSHVLQTCPVTHWERIDRHNEVVTKIARHCKSQKWSIEEEPHIRHSSGVLFKPDLAVHQPGDITVIADVQVAWDSGTLNLAYERKRSKYDVPLFRDAASKRWPGKTLVFAPIILGARGIWPRINNDHSGVLKVPPSIRQSCVHSVLKWGSSIHKAFSKAVWSKHFNGPAR